MIEGWRVVVLGVAQDGGMPHLGCDSGPCADARAGRRPPEKVACLGLTNGRSAYLFDATPDLPAQVSALGAALPSGIFLTHAHTGHYVGLVHLGLEAAGAEGVRVYATPAMRGFLLENAPWIGLARNGHVRLEDNAAVQLDGVRVTAFQVPHRQEFSDTVGYRIEGPRARVLYLPDIDRWEAWGRDLRREVHGVDHAFLDGTFFARDEVPGRDMARVPHPLVTDTMARLEGLGARVWFTHLNHTNPLLVDPAPAERRGFRVAREGLSFAI